MKIWRNIFMMLAAFSLASCSSDDDDKDIVEQVTIFVSAETGTYQNVPDNNYVQVSQVPNLPVLIDKFQRND